MILGASLRSCILAGFACMSAPAWADVLEISGESAHWVTGDRAGVPVDGMPVAVADAEGVLLPAEAIADPQVHARAVPVNYSAKVAELAARYDLSPVLIEALVWQESRWNAGAVSPKGAQGLAQLMPGTARELGVDPRDPFANLEGGARYLRAQLDRFDGDLEKALAAYNAGPGRVERAGGVPDIRETRNYVAAIMTRLSNHSRSE